MAIAIKFSRAIYLSVADMSNKIKIKVGDLRRLVREAAESLGEVGESGGRRKEWDEFPDPNPRPRGRTGTGPMSKTRATPADVAAVTALVDNAAQFSDDLVARTLVDALRGQVLDRGEGLSVYGKRSVAGMLRKIGADDLADDLGNPT